MYSRTANTSLTPKDKAKMEQLKQKITFTDVSCGVSAVCVCVCVCVCVVPCARAHVLCFVQMLVFVCCVVLCGVLVRTLCYVALLCVSADVCVVCY